MAVQTLTNLDLIKALALQIRTSNRLILDTDYVIPSLSWLQDGFGALYFNWLKENELLTWRTDNDCDNFAFEYFTFARICHARTQKYAGLNKKPESIAVGIVCYHVGGDPKRAHAINIAFLSRTEFCFIEPQTRKPIVLTPEEKNTIWTVTI